MSIPSVPSGCRKFGLANRRFANIIATMAHVLRRIVILFAALAFIVTSVGWGAAGALMGLKPGHASGITAFAVHKTDHHHTDRAANQAAPCSETKDCGDNAWHEDFAESCCGTACHIATEAGACRQVLVPIAHALEGVSLEEDIKEASLARVERPPRSIIG